MSTQTFSTDPATPPREGFLIALGGALEGPISVGEFLSIGREDTNTFPLNDPYVSGRHARIEKRTDAFILRDLRSRNGTFLNGVRIVEASLAPGDRIRFGEREFLFDDSRRPKADAPFLKSKNQSWHRSLSTVPVFSQTEMPVLLLGASGCGKEVLAKTIHDCSRRTGGPFVSVNCSALSESLVESELFGHVRGSFTGATHDRKGAFEAARGGTLFLDEVGDLPLSLQPKLLRALENKEIKPVGSDRLLDTDVRIIAATHQNLQQKIQSGDFRADLYFRLNVIKLYLPDLSDRMEDFEDLLNRFCKEFRVAISIPATLELKKHRWPGNIRELKNAVARASALFPGERIEAHHVEHLIDQFGQMERPEIRPGALPVIKELEREMIKQRLIANHGNQRRTAADLNMPKSTLNDRIRAYGINVDQILSEITVIAP